jgi:hypothetical protein
MADWREDFVRFRVQGERHTGSVVDLPHETGITPERGGSEVLGHSRLGAAVGPPAQERDRDEDRERHE